MAFLCSCHSSTQENTPSSSENGTSTSQSGQKDVDTSREIQHIVQRTHLFSSDTQPDYFRLALHGDSITGGQVLFTITTFDGRLIYEERFSAADLEASMVYEMLSSPATLSDREAYIVKRMDEFVQPSDFVSPAIAPNAPAQTSFVNETTWRRIQSNPKAIGFKYLLGKEDGRLLVYDPEQKKAVRYGRFGG